MTQDEVLFRLKELIDIPDRQTERECGELLKQIPHILLPIGEEILTFVDSEQRITTGSIDLIICANETLSNGEFQRRVFVWELKAPQLHLFEIESDNRAKPSVHLYDAENKLLHYYDEVRKNGTLHTRWKLTTDDVKFGGIIIGKFSNYCRGGSEAEKSKALARQAADMRSRYFYEKNKIKLFTWDNVVNKIDTFKQTHLWNMKEPTYEINVTQVISITPSSTSLPE